MQEETKVCKWYGEEYEISELKKEANLGCLCDTCIRAIESRGETLTFEE